MMRYVSLAAGLKRLADIGGFIRLRETRVEELKSPAALLQDYIYKSRTACDAAVASGTMGKG
jgi:hypothetical protein